MNNNSKYKDSPLGKIPWDWEVKLFGEVFEYLNTPSFSRENLTTEKTKNEIYYIHYGDIHATYNSEVLDFELEKRVPFLKDEFYRENFTYLKEGDLVIADASEDYKGIGSSIEIRNIRDKKVIGGLHTLVARDNSTLTVNGFRTYIFRNPYVHNEIKKIATGISVYGISKSNLSNLKLPLPPIPEQSRIAEVLGVWDKAISNLQATIVQVELRNKWLMHELLTGKRRLHGFSGEWKRIHIYEVAKEVSIRNKKNKQLTVLSCTKYDGLVDSLEYWGRQIFSEDISTYKIVPKNHFAYATNHIEEGSIGFQSLYYEALISPMYTIFKTEKSIIDDFFFKLLKSHRLIYEYNTRMEGSIDRRGGLRWDAFSIIKINLPSLEEQTALIQVLQAADKEAQSLRTKLEKLKEQKKGLMQVLLTGKKRLEMIHQ